LNGSEEQTGPVTRTKCGFADVPQVSVPSAEFGQLASAALNAIENVTAVTVLNKIEYLDITGSGKPTKAAPQYRMQRNRHA